MKHIRLHSPRQRLGMALALIVLALSSVCRLHAQTTIDFPMVANGGETNEGGVLFSTIGEPIAGDSLSSSSSSGDITWIGFWQVLDPGSLSGVSEQQLSGTAPSTGITGGFPNPFSSEVSIEVGLAHRGVVRISVYDLLGREIARLAEGTREAGTIRLNWRPESLDPGNYFVRMRLDGAESPAVPLQYYR